MSHDERAISWEGAGQLNLGRDHEAMSTHAGITTFHDGAGGEGQEAGMLACWH